MSSRKQKLALETISSSELHTLVIVPRPVNVGAGGVHDEEDGMPQALVRGKQSRGIRKRNTNIIIIMKEDGALLFSLSPSFYQTVAREALRS